MYRVQTICHENLDSRYIDGIKMLYIQLDSTTRVQAVCDYKTKKSSASGIKCAGAAEITFQVKFIKFFFFHLKFIAKYLLKMYL